MSTDTPIRVRCCTLAKRLHDALWPMTDEQLKALGQVILSIGVAALLAAASLLFMPAPDLTCYGIAVRVAVLGLLSVVAILVGLILHRERGEGQ